jgi:hypothetical protein
LLTQTLNGHFGHLGVSDDSVGLNSFRNEVARVWHKWLSRRARKATLDSLTFNQLLKR